MLLPTPRDLGLCFFYPFCHRLLLVLCLVPMRRRTHLSRPSTRKDVDTLINRDRAAKLGHAILNEPSELIVQIGVDGPVLVAHCLDLALLVVGKSTRV